MATINDVARAAGVSPSTVSYVLSGRRPISAQTRERVQAAIAELGFHPHAGARALASRRTNVLALVVPLYRYCNQLITAYRAHVLAYVRRTRLMQALTATRFYEYYQSLSQWRG